jgi:1-acyl-sn-glycerol-3-phosphate acyltransferase
MERIFTMSQITKARAPLTFLPPKFDLWVLRLVTWVLPVWLKYKLKIDRIDAVDIDRLVEMYKQSQMGKLRLVLAFRHPSSLDPFCMAYLSTKILPAAARKHRIRLATPVFAHFLYDRGLPVWAGQFVGWLLPRLGGIPIHRGRADRLGLNTARDLLVNGLMPLALAPEGATNGHSELVSPLEPGAAQLGFWAMEDLVKAGRKEDVFVVAIGIQYYYIDAPWAQLERLIHRLELECGMVVDRHDSLVSIQQQDGRPMRKLLYDRFYQVGQNLLYQMENFYAQFYHYSIPERPPLDRAISRTEISQRLQQILDFALQVSESYFNIKPKGSKADRCRRIEQAGWDWIYREELKPPQTLSPVSHKLADRIATEADLRMWHMRIVESFVAVTGSYVKDKPTIDRFAEITLLMWDLVAQIKGDRQSQRPILGKRRVQMTICNPIPISDYWDRYLSGRQQAKQAVLDLTQELQTAMEGTIDRG